MPKDSAQWTHATSVLQNMAPPQDAPVQAPPGQPATSVGHRRSFWAWFFLGLITFGILYYVWHYQSFEEVHRATGTQHEHVFLWLGLVPIIGFIFHIIYMTKQLPALHRARATQGLTQEPTTGSYFTLVILGVITVGITTAVAYHQLQGRLNELWPA